MMRGSSLWLGPPVRFFKRASSQVMASSLPPSPLEQAGPVQLASSLFTYSLYSRKLPFPNHSLIHQPAFTEHQLSQQPICGLGTCPASHSTTRIWDWPIWLQSPQSFHHHATSLYSLVRNTRWQAKLTPGSVVNHAHYTCPQVEPLKGGRLSWGEEPKLIKMKLLKIKDNIHMFPYVETYLAHNANYHC